MITCALMGGLGNQMFQIAAAMALAFDVNDEFGINHSICYTPNQGNASEKYKSSIFKKIQTISKNEMPTRIYKEPFYEFRPLIKEKNQIIHGYFQSEKYFFNHRNKIIEAFLPSEEELTSVSSFLRQIQTNKKIVSLHIRRGDYLRLSHHHFIQSIDYYIEAMSKFKNCIFFIISDDIEWARQNLNGNNIFYSSFNNEIDDFYSMICCDHNIISNSTFSWWGAYLNQKNDKIVIAPKQWYQEDIEINISDLIPAEWIII